MSYVGKRRFRGMSEAAFDALPLVSPQEAANMLRHMGPTSTARAYKTILVYAMALEKERAQRALDDTMSGVETEAAKEPKP